MAYKLREGEKLLNTYRTYELKLMPTVIEVFVLIFVPWYFAIRYNFLYASSLRLNIFLLWTLLVAVFAFWRFIFWWLNYYLLTSERLLLIKSESLFKKIVTEIPLDRVLNISYKTTGFLSTLFHFADVDIQIMGAEEPFQMVEISDPEEVKDAVWQAHLKCVAAENLNPKPKPILNNVINDDSAE